MKITDLSEEMAAQCKKNGLLRAGDAPSSIPLKKLSEEEILAMQPESTRKAILRTDEERKTYWNTEIPKECIIEKEDWIYRNITPEEYALYKNIQNKRARNVVPERSSVSPERREKAIDAFIHSPHLLKPTHSQITGLEQIKSKSPIEIPKPKKWYEVFGKQDMDDGPKEENTRWWHKWYIGGTRRD